MNAREGFLGLLISAGFAARSAAGEILESTPRTTMDFAGGTGAAAARLIVALVAVLGLILLLQRVARRYGHGFTAASAAPIELLTQRSMGTRISLAVIRVMGKTLLVSVSPQGVQRVAELTANDIEGEPHATGGELDSRSAARARTRTRPHIATLSVLEPLRRFLRRGHFEKPRPAPRKVTGTVRPETPIVAQPVVRAPSPARQENRFSHELESRLQSLERYPSVSDVEQELAGGMQ